MRAPTCLWAVALLSALLIPAAGLPVNQTGAHSHVNAPPVITFVSDTASLPGGLVVQENVPTALLGLAIVDPDVGEDDDGMLGVTIAATHGLIRLASTAGLHFSVGDGWDNSVVSFTGSPDNLRAAITPLTYTSNHHWNGADDIVVTADDQGFTGTGGSMTASMRIPLTVLAVNDAPVVTVPPALVVAEDTLLLLSGVRVADSDAAPADLVTLTIYTRWGTLFAAGAAVANGTSTNQTVTAANARLATLSYRPAEHWNGDRHGPDVVTVVVDDLGHSGAGGAKQGVGLVYVTVSSVNDAPVIAVPGPQVVAEDVELLLGGVVLSDPDADDTYGGVVEFNLTARHGTVRLGSVSGLYVMLGDARMGSAALRCRGGLDRVNAALKTLRYRGAADWNGQDAVSVAVSDLGHSGAGGAQVTTAVVAVTVTAVNDAPTMTIVGASTRETVEDTAVVLTGLAVNDVDSLVVNVTLSAMRGRLLLSATSAQQGNVNVQHRGGYGSSSVSVAGPLLDVNQALSGLSYDPALNWNSDRGGLDVVTLVADDLSSGAGRNVARHSEAHVYVRVASVNDAPTVVVPGPMHLAEETEVAVVGVSMSDPDVTDSYGGVVEFNVTADYGSVLLGSSAGLYVIQGDTSAGSTALQCRGGLDRANAALETLRYRGKVGWTGVDKVSVSVSDLGLSGVGGAMMAVAHVTVNVTTTTDKPKLVIPTAIMVVDEDADLTLVGLSIVDIGGTATNMALELIVETTHGMITYVDDASTAHELTVLPSANTGHTSGISKDTVRLSLGPRAQGASSAPSAAIAKGPGGQRYRNTAFQGDVNTIQDLLAHFQYRPDLNYAGEDSVRFTLRLANATDAFGLPSPAGHFDVASFLVSVQAVNDPPVVIVPSTSSLTASEATSSQVAWKSTTSSSEQDFLSVSDVDADDGRWGGIQMMALRVSAVRGTLSMVDLPGLRWRSGAKDVAVLQVEGAVAVINAALRTLTYRGAAQWSGSDTIGVLLDDMGNSGIGAALTAQATLPIDVIAIDDVPVVHALLKCPFVASEDIASSLSGISATDIDGDHGNGLVVIRAQVRHGTLSLSSETIVGLSHVYNTTSRIIELRGVLASVNKGLAALTYTSALNFNKLWTAAPDAAASLPITPGGFPQMPQDVMLGEELAVVVSGATQALLVEPLDAASAVGGVAATRYTCPISVEWVNDAPELTAPVSLEALEDVSTTIVGVRVDDPDANEILGGRVSLTITAESGTIAVAPAVAAASGVRFWEGMMRDGSLALSNSVQQILSSALPRHEVQQIVVRRGLHATSPLSGTFGLRYGVNSTKPIRFDASAVNSTTGDASSSLQERLQEVLPASIARGLLVSREALPNSSGFVWNVTFSLVA